LEDALPQVTGEKESVWPTCPQGGKEPDMSNADVLRLVHDRVVKNHVLALGDRGRQRAEQLRVRVLAISQPSRSPDPVTIATPVARRRSNASATARTPTVAASGAAWAFQGG